MTQETSGESSLNVEPTYALQAHQAAGLLGFQCTRHDACQFLGNVRKGHIE